MFHVGRVCFFPRKYHRAQNTTCLALVYISMFSSKVSDESSLYTNADYEGTDGTDLTKVFDNEEGHAPSTRLDATEIDAGFEDEELEERRLDDSKRDEKSVKNLADRAEGTDSDQERNHNVQDRLKIDARSENGIEEQHSERLSQRSEGKTQSRSNLIDDTVVAVNSSSPPPYVKKMRNTPAKTELDDIYFLCKYRFPVPKYESLSSVIYYRNCVLHKISLEGG